MRAFHALGSHDLSGTCLEMGAAVQRAHTAAAAGLLLLLDCSCDAAVGAECRVHCMSQDRYV
jgi:hypothetical protein